MPRHGEWAGCSEEVIEIFQEHQGRNHRCSARIYCEDFRILEPRSEHCPGETH